MPWQQLGSSTPTQLAQTRQQLHCVAQVVASVPRILAPPADDWSHTAFTWDDTHSALVGAEIRGGAPFRVALRITDATVLILAADNPAGPAGPDVAVISAQPATSLTIDELYAWLTKQVVDLTGSALPEPLTEAESTLPEPCAAGQTFDLANGEALAELSRYYANSNAVLQQIHDDNEQASPVFTWPHHMDIALLISLERGEDLEESRSISFGMQPGDASYPEPYFYSSPWPYPTPNAWPSLNAGGTWHTEGFTAAILLGSTLAAAGDASAQDQALQTFARSAINANRQVLSGD